VRRHTFLYFHLRKKEEKGATGKNVIRKILSPILFFHNNAIILKKQYLAKIHKFHNMTVAIMSPLTHNGWGSIIVIKIRIFRDGNASSNITRYSHVINMQWKNGEFFLNLFFFFKLSFFKNLKILNMKNFIKK
jgi:hypothetical protein